ncbi:MAG: preprotein translocase subunit YajC [Oligoflexales bacterium]
MFEVALADAAQTAAAQPSFAETMVPFALIFIAMYFLVIRPQGQKAKAHQDLLTTLKSGDEVVTSGGIIGRVRSVNDEFISLDVGQGVLKIMKEHVTRLTKVSGKKTEK